MAIVGLGTDIVEIARIEYTLARWQDKFIRRTFTPDEAAYCLKKVRPAVSFAARFAAKEAFAKAIGTGLGAHFAWQDFAIEVLPSGRPIAILSPRVRTMLQNCRVHLSLSHSQTHAIATVVIEHDVNSR